MTTISPRRRRPCVWSPAARHDGDDLLDLRRIGWVAQALVAWSMAGVESRHRRRRSTATGTVEQKLGHDPTSGSWNNPTIGISTPAPTAAPSLPGLSSGYRGPARTIANASTR
jgi:hypothetical protein